MKKSLINEDGEVRELTIKDFKGMRPALEVVPQIVEAYRKRRLRGPQKATTKVQMTVRLSREVVDFFKTSGKGWQTRIDKALREYVKTHPN